MSTQATPKLTNRRSQRITARVPVVVSGSVAESRLVVEHTHTIAVNRHGGLIALRADTALGQKILLTNKTTHQSRECRVVYLGPVQSNKRQVGIEFAGAESDFWENTAK
jgi:acyl-coenzyme A thioesterase PaaI-like protein